MRFRHLPRRGAVLVAAMISMLVATSLVLTMLAAGLVSRRAGLVERDARQATLLIEAGRDKALAAWLAEDAYSGERWRAVMVEASEPLTAQVDITLRPTGDGVVAEVSVLYPRGSGPPIRRSQSFAFVRPSTDTKPSEE